MFCGYCAAEAELELVDVVPLFSLSAKNNKPAVACEPITGAAIAPTAKLLASAALPAPPAMAALVVAANVPNPLAAAVVPASVNAMASAPISRALNA